MRELNAFLHSLFCGFMDWLSSPAGRLAYTAFARSAAKVIAGALVTYGVVADLGGWESTALGALLFIGTEGLTQYAIWKQQQKLATAIASPEVATEKQLDAKIAAGDVASVTTRKDKQPRIVANA